ncbi:C4-dicarboxylate ABC transporter substrate-binding protein [Bradyrhizobium elkanii]|nr:C4-dicarboxylate ABC transporter substrate-binding protein [Bradyrhizobium elkanii]QOZ18128.1 C4-dicarboxylate ABC transporter substrate-binding protein [Bradyrhizobium sp. CCBAU 21365]RYM19643.1 C4-dicarboxylate ABC transporter substrate-binding protein [Bradyrhizobium elkanii]
MGIEPCNKWRSTGCLSAGRKHWDFTRISTSDFGRLIPEGADCHAFAACIEQRGRRAMIAGDYAYGFWRYLSIAGALAIFLGAGAFIMATLPPRELVMATGAEGSANYELGIRYREILAKEGVRLQLQPTSGSLENLKYLRDPRSRVSVGFIQGGTTTGKEAPELESLGTIFYEPLWLFRRSEIGEGVQALRGRRLSIGAEGSGGRALALQIMQRTRIDSIVGEISGYAPQAAAEKLVAGDIDAAFIVTAWESPVVQSILNAKGIELSSAQRADAFVAIYPFLHKLVLPAGVIDLLANRPPADVVLLAPKASLVVRADLHSALQYVLLNAAAEIHSQPGIFQKAGEFPAAESIGIPLSQEAQRYYKTGRPFLQGYLPFWGATLVEKVVVVLLPLAALLFPVFKFLPQTYDWMMQLRIRRLYDEIRSIESEMNAGGRKIDVSALNAKLDLMDQRANQMQLPNVYASSLYTLRSHIDLVRTRLAAMA